MLTVYDLVWASAERHPAVIAVADVQTGRRVSYEALLADVDAVAAGLAERGVRRGMMIATVLGSTFDHAILLLALARLGAVPALLNPRLRPVEVAESVRRDGLEGIIAGSSGVLAQFAAELPPQLTVGVPEGGLDAAGLRGDPRSLPGVPVCWGDEPAFVFYTSGTTGAPKGVVIPHRATSPRVLFMALQGGVRFGTGNRFIGLMPLHHVVGFYVVFVASLAFNGTWYPLPRFEPGLALDVIEQERVTCLFATPTHFSALLDSPGFAKGRVSSLQQVLYAGAPMSARLRDRVRSEFGVALCEIYGTTETMNSLFGAAEPMRLGDGEPLATTRLRPGFTSRVRVVPAGANPGVKAAAGDEGELLVDATADATFLGYLNRDDLTAGKLDGGWYRTGDAARMNADGEVTITGRIDDMIISGGENIHPQEVEAVLAAHPGVGDVAVVGMPSQRWGELVVACVVPAAAQITAGDLDAHCQASRLAGYKRPRAYLMLDSLPRNAANKVLRRALRARLPGPGDSASAVGDLRWADNAFADSGEFQGRS